MMEYGLIGKTLKHSCSQKLHGMLADYDYQYVEKPTEEEARAFLLQKQYKGLNVTIPYKRLACQLCDELDEGARLTGAVNTVVNRKGRLCGYNTDLDGFRYLAQTAGVDFSGKTVLILGTGGTSHTVQAVVRKAGAARILIASRTPAEGQLTYAQAEKQPGVQIIINTTPVGMYPDNGGRPIDPAGFARLEAVLDVVYNPLNTRLVTQARDRGVKAAGGLAMLVAQAECTSAIFTGRPMNVGRIDRVWRQLRMETANISLIGMPSCGKTTIGRKLARMMDRPFVDVDRQIEAAEECPVSDYIRDHGERAFRQVEALHTARLSAQCGQIIACGGGVVETFGNVEALRSNGIVIYIDRPISGLKIGGARPLSRSRRALQEMEIRRRPLYQFAADITVNNATDNFNQAARAALEAIYAYFGVERP